MTRVPINFEGTPQASTSFPAHTLHHLHPRPRFHPYCKTFLLLQPPGSYSTLHQPGLERVISRPPPPAGSLIANNILPPICPRPSSQSCSLPSLSEIFSPTFLQYIREGNSRSVSHASRPSCAPSPERDTPEEVQKPSRASTTASSSKSQQIEPALRIRCMWVGCGVLLEYNKRTVSAHVMTEHVKETPRGGFEMGVCRWVGPDGHECGVEMQIRNFRRHITGIHTPLLTTHCHLCMKKQRVDALSRHMKLYCRRRP